MDFQSDRLQKESGYTGFTVHVEVEALRASDLMSWL